ncbi:uncharacterized protein [Temnothorax longispinosus]|uniref:uncharacterized protein n=1 Tax=Temnothorax longispinosus TaxID=300112 RepID=UPI003A992548
MLVISTQRNLQETCRHITPECMRYLKTISSGSAVNALRRVLLSSERKLMKSCKDRLFPKQVSDIKRNATQSLGKDYAAREVAHHADCVSYVKVQLKNENFHVDVGYCSTKEPTRGLAILNASIGSAVNGLKRVLMSFGEQFERELQRQIKLEQTNDVQDVTQSLDKQISEKLNVSDPTLVPTVNNDITETDRSTVICKGSELQDCSTLAK